MIARVEGEGAFTEVETRRQLCRARRRGDAGAPSLEELLAWTEEQAREKVASISGFGPKMVESVVGFLFDPDKRGLLDKLAARAGSRPQPQH